MEKDVACLGEKVNFSTLSEPEQKTFDGQSFPLILTPVNGYFPDEVTVLNWLKEKEADLKDLLLKYGAILFRGFPCKEPINFDNFVRALKYKAFPYVGGAAPRNMVVGDVFTTNEAPPEKLIAFHHEVAQAPKYPKTIFFYCQLPSADRGQTGIVLSNVVYREIMEKDPDFVKKMEENGIRYIRVLPDGDDNTSAIGRGWQSTYLTSDKGEAGRIATEQGTSFEWLSDGCMKIITQVMPATRVDPRTGKMIWFNSIDDAYRSYSDSRNIREESVCFPDGTFMDDNKMNMMAGVLEDNAVDFHWQHGDVLMVDNIQVLHARRNFTPPRRVFAWMCI